ncbi:MAG: redox-regulated ATPase YchF [Syntrophomonadaceae bacterium]|jgi:GTP-binding protein YchF
MLLGIIGLSRVGKTTIFELLTETHEKNYPPGKPHIGMVRIPDERVDHLSRLFKPRKTTYAQLEIVDIPGLIPGAEKSSGGFLEAVRQADALLMVVRGFQDPLSAEDETINPVNDIEVIKYELLLADLGLVEKRLERIHAGKKKDGKAREILLLEKLKICLEEEKPLSSLELEPEETEMLSSYQFLTTKPALLCVNLSEDRLLDGEYPQRADLMDAAYQFNMPLIELSANIEKEIAELNDGEKAIFMEECGISEPGVVKISRSMYKRLGLISFFTVGEDEVKAWTIPEGTIAKKAAGKIHSDIERGFIRAEVMDSKDLIEMGSIPMVKEKGRFRLEGKEYQVKDGDVVHFRFNV